MSMLMIDLDTKEEEEQKRILWALSMLSEWIPFKEAKVFETKKGFHVYIDVEKEMEPLEIMVLQQILGSDRNREMFNYIRYLQGFKRWQVLYKKKFAKWLDGEIEISEEHVTKNSIYFELLLNATIIASRMESEGGEEES